MTASTKVGTRAASTFPVGGPAAKGVLQVAYGSYTLATGDDEDGDIFQLCRIPAGATVIGGYIQGKDLDTGTEAFDADLGWAANGVESADPDGFGNFGLWSGDAVTDVRPEAGIFYNLGGVLYSTGPKTFTNETIIQLEVNTAAGTLGGGIITAVVFYVFA
jgi:hypothetical protein